MPVFEALLPLILIKNITGVTTIWVWDENGGLLFGSADGDMMQESASTEETWQQIASLWEAHPGAKTGGQDLVLDFDSYLLHARRAEQVLVAVMAEPHVNRHAVRLGLNLFGHQLRTSGKVMPQQRAVGNQR
jgi:hypothetical protein